MKRIFSILAAVFVVIGFASNALCSTIKDIPANYWAATEINSIVNDGIMTLDNGNFNPNQTVTRAHFTSMLLRSLGHAKREMTNDNKFTDVSKSHWAYNDILLSENIGLIYGYNDGTFRPDRIINKTETASIISHITKDRASNLDVLDKFSDASSIPAWGAHQYAKTIDMNIYVNHPNSKMLTPTKSLNRAEAAVLLYKLRLALNLVKEQYVAPSAKVLGTEHLNVYDKAPVDEVQMLNTGKIVRAQNVVKAAFEYPFSSKVACEGDKITLIAKEDACTKEGTLVIPRNTKFEGYVASIIPQKVFNKNAKVTLNLTKIVFPSGKCVPCNIQVYENDGVLTPSGWATTGKLAAYTVGGAAVGAGAGVGIAAIDHPHKYGRGVAIGTPVGAGVGLVTGLITPGLPYKAGCKDEILLILCQDVYIPN